MSYNGWSNYETWNVALWLDNEEFSYHEMSSYASHHDVSDIAKFIESYVDDNNPIASNASMYSDMLSAALREVDYVEIAEHYYADNHEIEPEDESEELPEDDPYAWNDDLARIAVRITGIDRWAYLRFSDIDYDCFGNPFADN